MDNNHYSITATIKKLETKPRPSGEDHRVQIVLEFREDLGGRFPAHFDAATDGSAPPILSFFRPVGGVLPWKSVEFLTPRRLEIAAEFPSQETVFLATLKSIKVSTKWTEQEGDVVTYRLILEKFPEPVVDSTIGYYLGRKAAHPVTGKLSIESYGFSITDHGTATPATIR